MPQRPRPLRRLARQRRLRCPAAAPRSRRARGRARRPARVGVQIVAPRSNSAWAKSPGRARAAGSRQKPCGQRRRAAAWRRQRRLDSANSRATTRSTLPSTGTTGWPKAIAADRRGGIGADARQRPQRLRRLAGSRRAPRPPGRRRAGCGRGRSSRARPIPPSPPPPARGQRLHVGEAREEALEARPDRGDRGLLQHDLGQPDPVRIGPSRPATARQGSSAAVAVVPGEQQGGGAEAAGADDGIWPRIATDRRLHRRPHALWPAAARRADPGADPAGLPQARARPAPS